MTSRERESAILAVIDCGLDQGMKESAFGEPRDRATVRAMARKGMVKVTRTDGIWIFATRSST